jgi:hypothetical protein
MNPRERYIKLARDNGWSVVKDLHDENLIFCNRPNERDGYPHSMRIRFEGRKAVDGRIWNDYGDGPEEFKVGLQVQRDVLVNVNHPLRYKLFYDTFLQRQPASRSEKSMALATGYSERQIRKARMCGYVDAEMLDELCVKLLAEHPATLYGFTNWVSGVDLNG